MLGLCCCCTGFYTSCREQGLLSSCGVWASHCGSSSLQGTGSRACGASEVAVCGGVVVTPSSKAQAQQLWYMGLIVLWPVGSSWVRYWTCVSWIGRWILYHWATREAHKQHIPFFFKWQFLCFSVISIFKWEISVHSCLGNNWLLLLSYYFVCYLLHYFFSYFSTFFSDF